MHVYDGLAGRRDHETLKTNPGLLPTLGKAASTSETSKLLEFKTGNPDLTHRGKDLAPRLQRCGWLLWRGVLSLAQGTSACGCGQREKRKERINLILLPPDFKWE